MTDNQQAGRDFETEIAKELGLEEVPGSGNQWHSKLDLVGKAARWSLKFTSKKSYSLSQSDVDEALRATGGLTGDARTPVWLIRLESPEYDLVVLRKEDFIAMQKGEIQILSEKPVKSSEVRRARSKIPVLLRGTDDD